MGKGATGPLPVGELRLSPHPDRQATRGQSCPKNRLGRGACCGRLRKAAPPIRASNAGVLPSSHHSPCCRLDSAARQDGSGSSRGGSAVSGQRCWWSGHCPWLQQQAPERAAPLLFGGFPGAPGGPLWETGVLPQASCSWAPSPHPFSAPQRQPSWSQSPTAAQPPLPGTPAGTEQHGLGLHPPHLLGLQVAHHQHQPVLELLLGHKLHQATDHRPGFRLPHVHLLHVQRLCLRMLGGHQDRNVRAMQQRDNPKTTPRVSHPPQSSQACPGRPFCAPPTLGRGFSTQTFSTLSTFPTRRSMRDGTSSSGVELLAGPLAAAGSTGKWEGTGTGQGAAVSDAHSGRLACEEQLYQHTVEFSCGRRLRGAPWKQDPLATPQRFHRSLKRGCTSKEEWKAKRCSETPEGRL